jgi:hypothetical protein
VVGVLLNENMVEMFQENAGEASTQKSIARQFIKIQNIIKNLCQIFKLP